MLQNLIQSRWASRLTNTKKASLRAEELAWRDWMCTEQARRALGRLCG